MADDVIFRDLDPSLNIGADGDIKTVTNIEAIYASLENILLTVTGERVMLRTFPGLLHTLLFDPLIADSMKRAAETELIQTIERWDDRIRIQGLDITIDQDNDNLTLNAELYIRGYDQIFTFSKIIR